MLRSLVLSAAASVAVLATLAPGASAAPFGSPVPPLPGLAGLASFLHVAPGRYAPLPLPLPETPDHFTITVTNPAAETNTTVRLECDPAGGTHPQPQAACDRLTELARQGKDPFAPVSEGAMCTAQYGGRATAHVTGSWQGRNIDSTFTRKNGCEIGRWRTVEPVLPAVWA